MKPKLDKVIGEQLGYVKPVLCIARMILIHIMVVYLVEVIHSASRAIIEGMT